MAFTEDIAAFLDTDDFAVVATHSGSSKSVIFERSYLAQFNVQTSAPTALGRKSDWTSVAQGDTVVIGGTSYTVGEFHHDPPDMPDLTLLLLKV